MLTFGKKTKTKTKNEIKNEKRKSSQQKTSNVLEHLGYLAHFNTTEIHEMSDLESIIAAHESRTTASLLPDPSSSSPSPPPGGQAALDHLVAGLDHLHRTHGIGVAAIDGRIRVSDPNRRMTPAIRDRLKSAIHNCWPDGRYD
jgi:hypothetical protein